VPVCAADLTIVERDEQPEPRRVASGEHLIPYWNAPDAFAPWFSGFFRSIDGCAAHLMLDGMPLGRIFSALAAEADDGVITSEEIFGRGQIDAR
jgi:hypothetical protein